MFIDGEELKGFCCLGDGRMYPSSFQCSASAIFLIPLINAPLEFFISFQADERRSKRNKSLME